MIFGQVRLTAQAAKEIRVRFSAGETVEQLKEIFSVSDQAVRDVLNFETWAGAGGPRRTNYRDYREVRKQVR